MTNLAPHGTFDLFDHLLQNLVQPGAASAPRAAAGQRFPRMIAIDVFDSAEQYRLLANLPGVRKDDVELTIEGSRVAISATSPTAHEPESTVRCLAAERFAGKWQRTLELPEEVDDEKVSATLKDGVLELVLPKKTPRGIRRVEIH